MPGNRIRPLPDHVINQIAAGEVIERPASIVKELVENSLDAGAHLVAIEVDQGGIERIRVTDDGSGIDRGDLAGALTRHCTSKLDSAEDLLGIATLGFRGEALASIAAVARLRLQSRAAGNHSAFEVSAAGAALALDPVPVALPAGTSIEVSDLFFNARPRRRFLRRPVTEFHNVLGVVRRMAFSHFDVQFRLRHDGRDVLLLPAITGTRRVEERVEALLGRRVFRDAVAVDEPIGPYHVRGWLGAPGSARSQSDLQFLIVNGRAVRDRQLQHAIRLAYEDSVPSGRYPCFALSLRLPLDQVDVNVHPTKSEVRFRDLRQVHDVLLSVCRRGLASSVAAGRRFVAEGADADGTSFATPAQGVPASLPLGAAASVTAALPAYRAPGGLFREEASAGGILSRVVGGRWIVQLSDEGLTLLDGRAIVERTTRQLLQGRADDRPLESRPLLLPQSIHARGAAPDFAERLAPFGFELEPLGPEHFVLRGIPVRLLPVDAAAMARAIGTLNWATPAELADALATAVRHSWVPPEAPAAIQALLSANERLDAPVAPAEFADDWPEQLLRFAR